jgi:hypothetical protein
MRKKRPGVAKVGTVGRWNPAALAGALIGIVLGLSAHGARAGAPAGPAPWADVGSTPRKFEKVLEDGSRYEVWAKNGKREGRSRRWNAKGVVVSDAWYERDVCRSEKAWDETGAWSMYGEWDARGQIVYQVGFEKDGKRVTEVGRPTGQTPADVPRFDRDSIPAEVVERAEAYVRRAVAKEDDKDYFAKNYRFVRERSEFYFELAESHRYFLHFEYAPLARIGAGEEGRGPDVIVQAYDGKHARIDGFVAAVDERGRVVEPRIPRGVALALAATRFPKVPRDRMSASLVTPSWVWGEKVTRFTWAVYVTEEDAAKEHGVTTTVYVDAVSGEVLGESRRGWAR